MFYMKAAEYDMVAAMPYKNHFRFPQKCFSELYLKVPFFFLARVSTKAVLAS